MTSKGDFEMKSFFQILLLAFLLAFSVSSAWADDEQAAEDETDTSEAADEDKVDLGKVVVTGSRLQRETYTSIQPLQIITAEGSREAGLVDTADILQQSTAAAGQQIDLTFSGFVLDNGPGASTIDLRGLGAGRTLVLLNGRRLAPSGVEGAPASPDLNLIPGAMVQRYEILLDGASSVYGSDAVAGVTNIIMRKDYDGFEFDAFYNMRDQGSGDSYTVNAAWGKNFDRGMIGIGLEYNDNKAVTLDDSKWTKGCEQHREVDENGVIRTQEQFYNNVYGMPWDECRIGLLAGRVSVGGRSGSIYHTPGFSNGGWPNFSESSQFGFGVDSNGDGVADLTFRDYSLNGKTQYSHLFPESDRLSIMGYGEYTFEGDMNNTVFFEANYNDRSVFINSGEGQLFPVVGPNNPFSICNPDGIRGVDCGLAQDALYTNPGFVAQFGVEFEDLCASFGFPIEECTPALFGLLGGPTGPTSTQPIASVRGDRNTTDVAVDQVRVVVGLKGDLPFVDWGSMNSWVYDVAFSYTKSEGTSHRLGVRGDRLDYSLATSRFDADGNIICGDNDGCVPIDMFAASLYPVGTVVGDFATQAERDYLFDSRDFVTDYTQTIFTAFADGFLFELPGGTAMGGIGIEFRDDKIKSIPDEVARDGLLWGFFSDGGATGSKTTSEIFGEIELPILANRPMADELVVNLSARWTDDELYGSDTTGSAKVGWRPTPSLLFRATYGTSFRAPNLREVFLEAQTGFNNVQDPCVIPEEARNPITGGYDPALDNREPQVLENCFRTGVDPTALDNFGFTVYSVEIARGGSLDLDAETSRSYTYGFAFDQPWSDSFDLTFGATWYDIKIDDTIIEPSSQFLVNDCYFDEQLDSSFCDQLHRDSDGFLSLIDAGHVNRDEARAKGVDINVNFDKTFNIGSRGVTFGADFVANHPEEVSQTFLDDDGNEDFDDFAGEWGFPDWKAQLGLRFNISDFRFTWVINYIGEVDQDPDAVDEFSDAFNASDTCLGPPTDVLCRDVGFGDDYWLHSASLYYYADTWTLGAGIRNVFDEHPPFVDGTEVLAINNVPIGYGYDLRGRTFFVNVVWRP